MKAIMISIKPKWCAKIMNGDKSIEIRKTMPKCDLPIDVYIYCTKDREILFKTFGLQYDVSLKSGLDEDEWNYLNGKVVAKFTVRKVEEIKFHFGYYNMGDWFESYILENACLTSDELDNYLKASKDYNEKKIAKVCGYAYHIEDLVIFDKPKELSEFKRASCKGCFAENTNYCDEKYCRITKAPQNFVFVESEE